jgi:hypothetical protein
VGATIHYQFVRKFGRNQAVGTSFVPIVSSGAVLGFRPDAAAATTVVCADADDTDQGTGAWTIEVQGVDATGEYVHETVALNGGTKALANEYLFIHRALVATAGTSHVNEGIITFQHGATIIAQIDAGWSQTEIAAFYVNDGGRGINVKQVRASAAGGPSSIVDLQIWTKVRATGVERMIGMVNVHGQNAPAVAIQPSVRAGIPPGTWIWIEAKLNAGSADVGAAFDIEFN